MNIGVDVLKSLIRPFQEILITLFQKSDSNFGFLIKF